MTKSELKDKLVRLGISEHAYALHGGLWDDRYVLNQEPGGEWSVYYSERSQRIGYKVFENESEACKYLLKKLENDPSTRVRR
jgi:hypothetical protein